MGALSLNGRWTFTERESKIAVELLNRSLQAVAARVGEEAYWGGPSSQRSLRMM